MPLFFHPPSGTREHAVAQHNMQRMKEEKKGRFVEAYSPNCPEYLTLPLFRYNDQQQSLLKNPNIHHMGPAASGQRMENFVIMYRLDHDMIDIDSLPDTMSNKSACSPGRVRTRCVS